MIKCNCGEINFQIMESEDNAKFVCAGCGREIFKIKKSNLDMTGFVRD